MTQRPLSPEEKMMHSYFVGKGLYSGIQLKNLLSESGPKADEEDEKFVIKLPKERLQHLKKSSVQDFLLPVIESARGFNDKKREHMTLRKQNLQKQLEDAQAQYLKALSQTKKADLEKTSTPNVDAMCLGILSEIEKKAERDTISDGALLRSLSNVASPITKHFPSVSKTWENTVDKPLLASTLAMLLLKKQIGKKDDTIGQSPMNVQVEAI